MSPSHLFPRYLSRQSADSSQRTHNHILHGPQESRHYWTVWNEILPPVRVGFTLCRFSPAGHGLARRSSHVPPRGSIDTVFLRRRHGRVGIRPGGARMLGRERRAFGAIVSKSVAQDAMGTQ